MLVTLSQTFKKEEFICLDAFEKLVHVPTYMNALQ